MNKIKFISLFFRVFFQLLFVALPVLLVIAWIQAPQPFIALGGIIQMDVIPRAYSHAILHTLSITEKGLGLLLNLAPLMIELFILFCLIRLFRLYEQGEIFSLKNVRFIRNLGYALLIGQLINPVYEGLMGVILTMNNPHGHRFASITLDQTNIGIVLTALMVILVSWIMTEGCKLREEQQFTI